MKLLVSAKLFTVLGFFLVICFSLFVLFTPHIIWGAACERKKPANGAEAQQIRDACQKQVDELRQQSNTLTKQIQYMDSQIYLTELNIQENQQSIEKIQEEIELLGERIGELNSTLTQVSETTTDKIRTMYKRQRRNPMLSTLASDNLTVLLRSVQYLKRTQENDRNIILRLQNTKTNFNEKKSLREEKEVELNTLNDQLASYKTSLATQQQEKENLLIITKNDEVRYKQLLDEARAEYEGINAVIAGGGNEQQLREVSSGDVIAYLIPTASCNSTGEHLHFTIEENSAPVNPFSYLSSVSYNDYSGGDSFNPSGSWNWPIDGTIDFNQGYGNTVFSGYTSLYNFHNGIDISGSSTAVRAVQNGTLYKGNYTGSGGCVLPYVKVKHKDSNITTYYLHVYSS